MIPQRGMDAASLVARLHGDLLRTISEHDKLHFQGLRAAASHLRRARCLPGALTKKLLTVEEAHNLCRHITSVSASGLLDTVSSALLGGRSTSSCSSCASRPSVPMVLCPVPPFPGFPLYKDLLLQAETEYFDLHEHTAMSNGQVHPDGCVNGRHCPAERPRCRS